MAEDKIKALEAEIVALKKKLDEKDAKAPARQKIEEMSAEVVDSNPYR